MAEVQADRDQVLVGRAAEVPEVGDQAPAGREPEGQMVWVRDRGDRAAVSSVRARGQEGRVPEVPVVSEEGRGGRVVDQAVARKGPALGLAPVVMAAQPLSRE